MLSSLVVHMYFVIYTVQFVICVDIDFHESVRNQNLQIFSALCSQYEIQIALDTTHNIIFFHFSF